MLKTILYILFFVLALAIIFGVHYFIYYSLIHFFGIESNNLKTITVIILILLPVSFIVSNIFAHYSENILVSKLMLISGLWLGFLTTLFAFFIITWVLVAISKLLGIPNFNTPIGITACILAILYSGYGVYLAYHPVIKHIKVNIPGLSENWKGQKITLITDVHLGHILGRNFFDNIIEKVNSTNPQLVLIGGDLFDGMGNTYEYVAEDINKIIAPEGVYFVTGNHETYFGVDKTYKILEKSKIYIFKDNLKSIDGLQIVGINYPERGQRIDLDERIKNISDFDKNQPAILLYHEPVQIGKIKESGVNLELCGHTHGGQIFPLGIFTYLIYGPYERGLHQLSENFTIFTSIGAGTWGPTMRTWQAPEIISVELN